MIDTEQKDQVNTITNPADTNPQPGIVDPMAHIREQEISHNLKAQGELIENQKKTIQKYETQLAEAQNKLQLVNQAPAPIQPAVAPQTNPQENGMVIDPTLQLEVQGLKDYVSSLQEKEKQQAFQPVKKILEQYNVVGEDQNKWLEYVKINKGIDFINNPDAGYAEYILNQSVQQSPQTMPQGRAAPVIYNQQQQDIVAANARAQATNDWVAQQVKINKQRP